MSGTMHTSLLLGLLDSLAGFWGKVTQEFAGSPYILGYEIINEPSAGKNLNQAEEWDAIGLYTLTLYCI